MTLRSLSALVLALMLALTGQSMAVARGASAATSAPHICPDSALNVAMAGAVVLAAAPMRIVTFVAPAVHVLTADVPRRKTRHDPRAPPVAV